MNLKKATCRKLYLAIGALVAFVLWTIAVCCIDVKPIGPLGSDVGFATINGYFHKLTGVHMTLYNITDWLGLVPFGFAFYFSVTGLVQWIIRKKLMLVDYNILVLGGFYVIVIMVFFFFENVVINYRPILINGVLEASYPSSTTMTVMCVMMTTIVQLRDRIKNKALMRCVNAVITMFIVFMVICRLISGVHWLTDIIAGVLISFGLVMLYCYICCKLKSITAKYN